MGIAQIWTMATLVVCLAHAEVRPDIYLLDDFERPQSLATWRITGDGSLQPGVGYRGHGAALQYGVSRDAPVVIEWHPTAKLPKFRNPVVSLWARFPGDVQVTLQA